jgi:DNA-binding response OmpR family regulator
MKAKILLAEDDKNLGFLTKEGLESAGYSVDLCQDGVQAWRKFSDHALCIIDIMMPEMDGFSLAENIRSKDELVPILFLTAKSREEDRLRGFEIGGDDYISKPFSMQELVYRVEVFIRRTTTNDRKSSVQKIGNSEVDFENLVLTIQQKTQRLTQREADLLRLLLSANGQLVKREEILEKIWGQNDYFMGRSLDVFISRLRKYLKPDVSLEIRNHHGVGFSFQAKK